MMSHKASSNPQPDWRSFIPPKAETISVHSWVARDLAMLADDGSASIPDIRLAWRFLTDRISGETLMGTLKRAECMAVFKWAGAHLELSAGSLSKHRGLLSASCGRAMQWGYLESNPFRDWPRGVMPEVKDQEDRAAMHLSPADAAKLLSCAGVPLFERAEYTFLIATGERAGEAMEARWSDIREMMPLNGVRVARSWSSKRKSVGPTKTKASALTPLHPVAMSMLDRLWDGGWAERFGRAPQLEDLLFPRKIRGEITHDAQAQLWERWARALKTAGLKHRPLHCTRHTFMALGRMVGCEMDALDSLIHPKRSGDTKNLYGGWPWERLCVEISKLPLAPI